MMLKEQSIKNSETNPSKNVDQLLIKVAKNNSSINSIIFHGPDKEKIESKISFFIHQINTAPKNIEFNKSDHIQEPYVDTILLNPTGNSIKIDMIKSIQQRIKYGASNLNYCIVIVHNINRLTISASNALLKSIEEPQENTIFIFSTQNKAAVLPTILSRCQHLYIPVSSSEVLEKIDSKKTELSEQLQLLNVFDFLNSSLFDQVHYIHSLPYKTELISELLIIWKGTLFQSLEKLRPKEIIFLEKIIEIIGKIKYNFNLKLQLVSLIVELDKED